MSSINLVKIKLEKDGKYGEGIIVGGVKDAVKVFCDEMPNLDREHLYVLNMNAKGKVVNANLVSMGTVDNTVVHPREIMKSAILSNSGSIILLHNHPSGDCTPSNEDREICKKIQASAFLMNIQFLDFIVVGDNNKYYSFAEKSELPHTSIKEAFDIIEQYSSYEEEQLSGVFIERYIDGIPYSFELTDEEIKAVYEERFGVITHKKENIKKKEKSKDFELGS